MDAQRTGNLVYGGERRVPLPALDAADVGPMHVRQVGEFLLGEAGPLAQLAHHASETEAGLVLGLHR